MNEKHKNDLTRGPNKNGYDGDITWDIRVMGDWVNDIHSHTRDIYKGVSAGDNLGYEYQYKNFPTVKKLILKGGLRLAAVLNYLFD